MPDRHLTTQLHPCSGVKVLLEATPTASGGHHKLHVHANRCARVPFQGKASDSSYDATAAGALPAEHLWNAPAVFSGKCGMAAGSHKHARDAQLVPRGGPPERLPRLVSRSVSAVAPLQPQRPLVQPHGSAEGLLWRVRWVLVFSRNEVF